MKEFLKYYNNFFLWAGINEEQFLNDNYPNIKGSPVVSSEWADEYPSLSELILSVENFLKKKNYKLSFLNLLAVCFLIDQEGENIADLTFKYLSTDEIFILCKFSIENKTFDIQRQLVTRVYENNLPPNYIDFIYENTEYEYIKKYITDYLRTD